MALTPFASADRLAGSATTDSSGKQMYVQAFQMASNTYQLATSVSSLAAGASTGQTAGIAAGSYVWSYVLGGTSPQLKLEYLGPDGATWIQLGTTATANGSQGVVIGDNATVRLTNGSGSNAITGLSSSLT